MEREIYAPLNYYHYNLPHFYGCIFVGILFFVFLVILFQVFKYETDIAKNSCDPSFYYGQSCNNELSNAIQKNPQFMIAKQAYYNKLKKYKAHVGANLSGITDFTNEKTVIASKNAEFMNDTITKIQGLTVLTKQYTEHYLGNIQDVLRSGSKTSETIAEQLDKIPGYLAILKKQIGDSLVHPLFVKYADPLKKLYKSLQ